MTVTSVHKDPETLTMTITSHFDATVDRVWQLWEDPRQLERWWGPPTYPATVLRHDLSEGGSVDYLMTGPDGDQSRGWWRVLAVKPPHYLEVEDGFADADGNPDGEMPTMVIRVTIEPLPGAGTSMAIETMFPSADSMAKMMAMGLSEGMAEALGQIDAILAG